MAVDSAGNIYIADTNNFRVRKVSNGIITTVAGNGAGAEPNSGDNRPAIAGSLYISDGSGRVREIANGVIRTIAGNGGAGFGGDNGPATGAEVASSGVVIDSSGNIYVADSANARIQLLSPSSLPVCSYSVSPLTLQVPSAGGSFSINIQTDADCSWTVSNPPSWITSQTPSSGMGSATVTISVAPNSYVFDQNASVNVAGIFVAVKQALDLANLPPVIAGQGVTNAASFDEGIVPGGIVTIFGSNLGASAGQTLTAAVSPWPSQLGTTSVTMNGITAPVYYVLIRTGRNSLVYKPLGHLQVQPRPRS